MQKDLAMVLLGVIGKTLGERGVIQPGASTILSFVGTILGIMHRVERQQPDRHGGRRNREACSARAAVNAQRADSRLCQHTL